jgi:hypothetical protein
MYHTHNSMLVFMLLLTKDLCFIVANVEINEIKQPYSRAQAPPRDRTFFATTVCICASFSQNYSSLLGL